MTGLYTNWPLNWLRKLLILTLFFQNENYNCLKYLFLINGRGKPNKIIYFILYPFNIYTVLYVKIIIVGVFLFKNECKVLRLQKSIVNHYNENRFKLQTTEINSEPL